MAWVPGVLTSAEMNTYVPQSWSTWSPTITAETGTFTSVTVTSARYIQPGKTVHWSATFTITTAGTAAGALRFTLPVTAQSTNMYLGSGRETAATGASLLVFANSATVANVNRYDNTTGIASGRIFILSGTYEAA